MGCGMQGARPRGARSAITGKGHQLGSGRAKRFAAAAVAALLLAALSAVLVASAASSPRPLKYACASNLYNAKKVLKYVARPSVCHGSGKTLVNFKADDPVYPCRKEHGGFA